MRRPLETARRWLAQAEHSLAISRLMFDNGYWSDACFPAEQTARLALKAFLYRAGKRAISMHLIRELVVECGKEDQGLLEFLNHGGVLDRYYLSDRYPDALPPPALPFEAFSEEDARQALSFATEIAEAVKSRIPATIS